MAISPFLKHLKRQSSRFVNLRSSFSQRISNSSSSNFSTLSRTMPGASYEEPHKMQDFKSLQNLSGSITNPDIDMTLSMDANLNTGNSSADSNQVPKKRVLTTDVLHALIEANETSQLKGLIPLLEELQNIVPPNSSANNYKKDAKATSNTIIDLTSDQLNSYRGEDGWGILHWCCHHAGNTTSSDGFDDCGKVGCCEGEETVNDSDSVEVLLKLMRVLVPKYSKNADSKDSSSPPLSVNINMRTEYDRATPLMFAAEGRNKELIKCLLELGADVDLNDDDEDTAFDWEVNGIKEKLKAKKEFEQMNNDIPEESTDISQIEDYKVLQKCIDEVANGVSSDVEEITEVLDCVEIDAAEANSANNFGSLENNTNPENNTNLDRPVIPFPSPSELLNMDGYEAINKYFYDCIENSNDKCVDENCADQYCGVPTHFGKSTVGISGAGSSSTALANQKSESAATKYPLFTGERILPAALLKVFVEEDNVSEKLLSMLSAKPGENIRESVANANSFTENSKIAISKSDTETYFSEEGWTVLHWCAHVLSEDAGLDACDQCGRAGMEDVVENGGENGNTPSLEETMTIKTVEASKNEHEKHLVNKVQNIRQLLKFLIKDVGVNVDVRGQYDEATALMLAACDADTKEKANPVYEILLSLGADVSLKDCDGNGVEYYRSG